jgi:hypothetical protein
LSERIDVREHLRVLIDALVNLSPSRNLISQFTLMLPKDLAIVERSYPEITFSSEAKTLLAKSFGVEFGDIVKRTDDSFSAALYTWIHKLFDWFEDEEVRSNLAKLLGAAVSSIPNPYAEWAKLVFKKLSQKPNSQKIFNFLRLLIERYSASHIVYRNYQDVGWQPFLEEARKKISANPAEFQEIINITAKSTQGGELLYSLGSRRHPEKDVWLLHSDYHLDILLEETRYYESYYSRTTETYQYIRHADTIKNLLREVSI